MKKNISEKITLTIVFVIFILFSLSLIIPFIWIGLNSFKTDIGFRANSFGVPQRWIFANYANAVIYDLNGINMMVLFTNSLINIIGIVFPGLFFSTCTAYVFAKYHFKYREFLFSFILIISVVPTVGSTAATFKMWHDIKLYDTFFSVIIMGAGGFGMGFLMLYAVFKNLSWSYAEAAFIDGASSFKVFLYVMLPQVIPVLSSLIIIQVIGVWNDYFTPYMYLPSKPTVAVGIFEIQSNATTKQQYPLLFAIMLLSVAPVLTLFVIFQNTIMNNTVAAGIKG